MYHCIERIEDGFAVCEGCDGEIRRLPLSELPQTVREGDLLLREESGEWVVDTAATEERRGFLLAKKRALLAKASPPPFVVPQEKDETDLEGLSC